MGKIWLLFFLRYIFGFKNNASNYEFLLVSILLIQFFSWLLLATPEDNTRLATGFYSLLTLIILSTLNQFMDVPARGSPVYITRFITKHLVYCLGAIGLLIAEMWISGESNAKEISPTIRKVSNFLDMIHSVDLISY